jgi:hypothetical protein
MAVAMVSLLPRIDYPLPGKATSSITQKVSIVNWGTIILLFLFYFAVPLKMIVFRVSGIRDLIELNFVE